jgi:hypothetical protein
MTLSIAAIVPTLALLAAQSPVDGPQARPATEAKAEQIACAPMSLTAPPVGGLRVSGAYEHGRMMFGPGEALIVNAGSKQGLRKGQMYFVRRHVLDMFTPATIDFVPVSIHTAGWVTIVDTKDELSVAQVTHACDGILDGDYLEPYTDPVLPPAALGGAPDYDHPARIVMADETLQTGSAGTLMLINRGSDHDVRAGQSLTIYRATMNGAGPLLDVGRGTILSVRPQTSLMRVDSSNDAVYIGDLAALHRIQ